MYSVWLSSEIVTARVFIVLVMAFFHATYGTAMAQQLQDMVDEEMQAPVFHCSINESSNTKDGKRIVCPDCSKVCKSFVSIVCHYDAGHGYSRESMQHHYIYKKALEESISKTGAFVSDMEFKSLEPAVTDCKFLCKLCPEHIRKPMAARTAKVHFMEAHGLTPLQTKGWVVLKDGHVQKNRTGNSTLYLLRACYAARMLEFNEVESEHANGDDASACYAMHDVQEDGDFRADSEGYARVAAMKLYIYLYIYMYIWQSCLLPRNS